MRLQLKAPTIEDVAAISRGFGVVLKQDNELLHEIAMKPGALRNVVKSLRLAYFAAQSERRPISGEDIWAARYALVQED